MKTTTQPSKRFGVALSFAGEQRAFVKAVAERLSLHLGYERVLYDHYYEAEFARPDLDTYLQRLYNQESELIAVFVCANYEKKEWCGLEWRVVRDIIKQRKSENIMPLRFDTTEIAGMFSIDGYVWIGNRSPEEIANVILTRIGVTPDDATQTVSLPHIAPLLHTIGSSAAAIWAEKLDFLRQQDAICSDPAQKFSLKKHIEEAQAKLKELSSC